MRDVTIGIVTALPIEAHAVYSVFDNLGDVEVRGDPNYYRAGAVPSADAQRPHMVVVAQQARDGTRNAAAVATDLVRSFPSLRVLIMCGIAGGVPAGDGGERGIRLGDIVVATEGVVDYDHVYTVDGESTPRRAPSPPSASLLRVDHNMYIAELGGARPWLEVVKRLSRTPAFARPDSDANDDPQVHRGAIGSADRLVRDAILRDDLAGRYHIKAVEMEASGIAAAAELYERSWFMVRGVADYGDRSKNEVWQPYAALVAAAYVRALLQDCRPLATGRTEKTEKTESEKTGVAAPRKKALSGLAAIVDGLLSLPQMSEEPSRRTLIRQLPGYIRDGIPDNPNPRLHVLNVVQTCAQFADGEQALIDALGVVLGSDSPRFEHTESVIREHWSGG
jgi:nucleoside phosphorylase